LYQFN